MILLTLIAFLSSFLIAVCVLFINPFRFSNQAYFIVSILQTAWAACVYRAMYAGDIGKVNKGEDLEFWLRTNAAIVAFLPAAIFLLERAILSCQKRHVAIAKSLPLAALGSASLIFLFSDGFLYWDVDGILRRGDIYFVFCAASLILFASFVVRIVKHIKNSRGIRRVEFQFLGLTTVGSALLIGMLNFSGNLLHIRALNGASTLVLILASALTAWALIFHRVFNAREILAQLCRRCTFILVLCGGTYGAWSLAQPHVSEPIGLLLSIGVCGSAAVWLDQISRGHFDAVGRRKLAQLRKAAIEIGNSEVRMDKLVTGFQSLLQGECRTESCTLLFDNEVAYTGTTLTIDKHRPGFAALLEMGWTTPESLARRKSTPLLADLRDFVDQHCLGLLIATPKGSPAPSLIIALGRRTDESPFTYPEIERMQVLAALFDNLLARARRASHAALVARIEYLAVASRGLAHDLKNLITPVSSFLVHTDGLFPPNSPAGDVHASARRATEVMSDYVRENLFFAEKLSPKLERFQVIDLLDQVLEAVTPAAFSRQIQVSLESHCQHDLSADRILLKRMLINLVSNAIDASAEGSSVSISATEADSGDIRLDVTDEGSGIPPENLARVFDPYFTTKEFGDELRGFGLGLTIAQKIVHLHRGQISVSSRKDHGTTFSVVLPNTHPEAASFPLPSADPVPAKMPQPAPVLP